MFLRPESGALTHFVPDWTILHAPGCLADPAKDGTRQENFVVLNFTRRMILIGGTAYTGEIKKGIFSVLNYLLPHTRNVLSMHCAANAGSEGDTALFFGLSGTGKTTLSTDPDRDLIGDDEHGWSDDNLFNFEGGCYAKCMNLSAAGEPDIYHAIRKGALVENVGFIPGSHKIDYSSQAITENTRVSYPIDYLTHICRPSVGAIPRHLFFLTCDAYGILPPISRLTPAQAMYHFISGYTAKVAGTEAGIDTPKATFSTCFGAPFLPLPPLRYAQMLGARMQAASTHCWLVNTGWTGGGYGSGKRIALTHTRAMVRAALSGLLDKGPFETDVLFGLQIPTGCPGVPGELWNPARHWTDPQAYQQTARQLAEQFQQHFKPFEASAGQEICAAAPRL
jgi:phosphoenolpyruvate carboxykinase (ATP)